MKSLNSERSLPVNSVKIYRDEEGDVYFEETKATEKFPPINQQRHLKSCDRFSYEKLKQEQERLLTLSQQINKIGKTNKDTIKE